MAEFNYSKLKNPLAFGKTLEQHITDISMCVSYEDFADLFKNLNIDSEKLKRMHEIIQDKINHDCQKHMTKILQEDDIIDMFKQANELESDGIHVDDIAWRPPGNVKKHLNPLDTDIYVHENERIENLLDDLNKENDSLMRKITDIRKKINYNEQRQLDIIQRCQFSIDKIEDFNNVTKDVVNNLQTKIMKSL